MTITNFSGPYRYLSNFWYAPLKVGDLRFATSEHAYQAAKSLDPADWELIQNQSTPGKAKEMGRHIKLRPDWDEIKLDVMRVILEAKFTQNPNLMSALIDTGDEELIEGNHWGDTYWGVCKGVGQNHLGKLLMELRLHYQ